MAIDTSSAVAALALYGLAASWPSRSLGNHRARLRLDDTKGEVAWARVEWRLPGLQMEERQVVLAEEVGTGASALTTGAAAWVVLGGPGPPPAMPGVSVAVGAAAFTPFPISAGVMPIENDDLSSSSSLELELVTEFSAPPLVPMSCIFDGGRAAAARWGPRRPRAVVAGRRTPGRLLETKGRRTRSIRQWAVESCAS